MKNVPTRLRSSSAHDAASFCESICVTANAGLVQVDRGRALGHGRIWRRAACHRSRHHAALSTAGGVVLAPFMLPVVVGGEVGVVVFIGALPVGAVVGAGYQALPAIARTPFTLAF